MAWQGRVALIFSTSFCVRFQKRLVSRAKIWIFFTPSRAACAQMAVAAPPAPHDGDGFSDHIISCISDSLHVSYTVSVIAGKASIVIDYGVHSADQSGSGESSSRSSTILFLFGMVRLKPRIPQVFSPMTAVSRFSSFTLKQR